MTIISKFQLNTHFTGLRQIPQLFQKTVSYNGGYLPVETIAHQLFSVDITVPAGVYVEMVAIQGSVDNNVIRLAHQVYHWLNTNSQVYFSLNQINPSTYRFAGFCTVLDDGGINLPAGQAKVSLALSTAPFTA